MNSEQPWINPTIGQRDTAFLDTSVHSSPTRRLEYNDICNMGWQLAQIVGPVGVPEAVNLTSVAYCLLLGSFLMDWLENVPLTNQEKIPLHPILLKQPLNFLHQLGQGRYIDAMVCLFSWLHLYGKFMGHCQA